MSAPTSTAASLSEPGPRAFAAIFSAGLLAGAMDITAAFVTWGLKGIAPGRILRGIASGLLGPQALSGGAGIEALGLALHFLIAFAAATVFYLASRKITFMISQPIATGIVYGVLVYVFMYWVVLPLSNYHRMPFNINVTIVAILTHMICVGLPISLTVHRYSK
jgi:uncharacterized membrane protein YagU involved in acid resistance